jgi:hypothetical protein
MGEGKIAQRLAWHMYTHRQRERVREVSLLSDISLSRLTLYGTTEKGDEKAGFDGIRPDYFH